MEVVKALCKKLGITPVYNIGYSPDLNAIEAVFSQVKRAFHKERLWTLARGKEFDIFRAIKKAFKEVTP